MLTFIYSALHMLVDGLCALGMYGHFSKAADGYFQILIYNFFAFAMQLPIGAVLDEIITRRGREDLASYLCMLAGVICTGVGFFTWPWLLGLGNALFHVGGGVGVIAEDNRNDWKGIALGIFVAPGALGLFVGAQLVGLEASDRITSIAWVIMAVMVVLSLLQAINIQGRKKGNQITELSGGLADAEKYAPALIASCFFVVVLRSYAGMSISFPWKLGLLSGLAAVIAVVLGKALGGILSAGFGMKLVIIVSLSISALAYVFSGNMICGILALLCFNMTMPITLYLLVSNFSRYKGTMFGLLTFGLFLGFLPKYFELEFSQGGNIQGAVISIVSLMVLIFAVRRSRNAHN